MTKSREWRTDPEFVAWLNSYPRRCAIPAAFLAWQKTRGVRPPLAVLQQSIARGVEWRRQLEASRQFAPAWPYPATWLNGERWEDEFDSLAGVPTLADVAPEPTQDQLRERRMAELARDCWIEIRTAVLKTHARPVLGWGHPAADQVLAGMGGLEALIKFRSRLPRAEAVFLHRLVETLKAPAQGPNVMPLRRTA